ncbi:MAG: TIM barrel protein, partial [Actinomycetota bacterium]
AGAGFTCVESWWPPGGDPQAWAGAVRAAGVDVAAVNADGGDIAAGERGFCTMPQHDGRTFAAVGEAVALAAQVGAPAVNVLAGLVSPDRPARDQWDHAVEVLRECGRIAAAQGRMVVVEPINAVDVPGYLVPTPDAAARLLAEVGHDAVRLLYDAYHAGMGGVDPVADVGWYADLIGHVQYADCPGRGAPGTGGVDLAAFVEALDRAGYAGPVGLELSPAGDTLAVVAGLAGLSPVASFT